MYLQYFSNDFKIVVMSTNPSDCSVDLDELLFLTNLRPFLASLSA